MKNFFYYELYDDTPAPVSIEGVEEDGNFILYPNPFKDRLTILWKRNGDSQIKITLVNVMGQKIYSTNRKLISGPNQIGFPSLMRGYYVLFIEDAKGNLWKRSLVKM